MKEVVHRIGGVACLALAGVILTFCMVWHRDNPEIPKQEFGPIVTEQSDSEGLVGSEELAVDEIERMEAGEDLPEAQPNVYGALPSRASWANEFRKARLSVLANHPLCEACGAAPEDIVNGQPVGSMNAHHVISVKRIIEEKLDPSLKWDPKNLIILCRGGRDCHHDYGHPQGWAKSNPNVREDAAKAFEAEWPGWKYQELVADYESKKPIRPTQPGKNRKSAKTILAP